MAKTTPWAALKGSVLLPLGYLNQFSLLSVTQVLWQYLWCKKTTLASKLAAKAATVPETPVRDSKPSPKKTVTPKKDKKDVDKETPIKGTPNVSQSEEVVEVPPSLEKKKSGYRHFMARDGPRTLGSKEIPQVGFKDLIVNSPLYLLHIFL